MLQPEQYADLALLSWGKVGDVTRKLTPAESRLNAVMGLGGEAGELMELFKKARFHAKPWRPQDLRAEMGDALYYVTIGATAHGFPIAEIVRSAEIRQAWRGQFDGYSPAHYIDCGLGLVEAAGRMAGMTLGSMQGTGHSLEQEVAYHELPPVVYRDVLIDYMTALAELALGQRWPLHEIALENIAKLAQRHPANFQGNEQYRKLVELQIGSWASA